MGTADQSVQLTKDELNDLSNSEIIEYKRKIFFVKLKVHFVRKGLIVAKKEQFSPAFGGGIPESSLKKTLWCGILALYYFKYVFIHYEGFRELVGISSQFVVISRERDDIEGDAI